MYKIDIDFDVYKALTAKRNAEEVTYNDVLREMLRLPSTSATSLSEPGLIDPGLIPMKGGWTTKGVHFPTGTEFRGRHKGQLHTGRVVEGALDVRGRHFNSPSAGAVFITETSVNGWVFWECRLPGRSDWQSIDAIRKASTAG